jgi:SHS2 domain-containing protein
MVIKPGWFTVLYNTPLPEYNQAMPYEELQHTADWALRVWAAELPALFAEAALGMNALSGVQLAESPRLSRIFETRAADEESLLVAFLSELVYSAEQERLAFDAFDVRLGENRLRVAMTGAAILSMNKSIKAVTYHNLKIRPTVRGVEVDIVFDV